MSRIAEMLDYIKEDMEKELEEWKLEIVDFSDVKVVEVLESLKTEVKTDVASIVITYLRSSYITGIHQFKVALYENEPFICEPTLYRMIDMTPLYKGVLETFDKFIRKIKSEFIHVFYHEVEEIRRFYMEYLYQNSYLFFESEAVKKEDGEGSIPIYYGEEMGEIEQIGVIGR